MKRVEAIVRPERLGQIAAELEGHGFKGFTISDVRGHGQSPEKVGEYRWSPSPTSLVCIRSAPESRRRPTGATRNPPLFETAVAVGRYAPHRHSNTDRSPRSTGVKTSSTSVRTPGSTMPAHCTGSAITQPRGWLAI